jgi:YesN/AraC family two-component response regulator
MSDQTPTDSTTPVQEQQSTVSPTTSEAKFTQADVDRLIAERLKRADEAREKKLLERLGVDTLDTAAERLKKAADLEAAQMSEIEKAQKELENERKKATAYEDQIKTMLAQQRIDRRNSKIVELAKDAKAKYPDDTIAWAEKNMPEELASAMAEDGTIDEKAIKALVDAHKKARPEVFVGGGPGSPSNNGGTPPSPDSKRIEDAMKNRRPVRL